MGARAPHRPVTATAAGWRFASPLLLAAMLLALAVIGCGRFIPRQPGGLDREPEPATDVVTYNIQVGLFDTQDEAETIAEAVRESLALPVTVVYKAPFYRVWVIARAGADEADILTERLLGDGYGEARRIFEEFEEQEQ